VISALREPIESLALAPDSTDLSAVLGLSDQLTAKTLEALGDFDADSLWELDGRTSLRDWLRVTARMSSDDAARMARTAQRLRDLPVTAAAFRAGGLSASQIKIIVRPLNNRRRPAFAEAEADLVPCLCELDCRDTERVVGEWVEMFDALHPERDPQEPANSLYHSRTIGDRGELRASFEAANAAIIDAALGVAETRDHVDSQRMPSERRADAMVDICRYFLDTHDRPRKRRHAPHINLVLTPEQLQYGLSGQTMDGRTLSGPSIAALACDSVVRRVVLAGGEILQMGRLVRTVPPQLFDAVAARDRGCRFPGCDRPPKFCDSHHVIPWYAGGLTDIANLALFCRRHHTTLHKRGWHAKLLPDATLEITTPTGQVLTTRPPRPGPLL
jgi:hypothetical protein